VKRTIFLLIGVIACSVGNADDAEVVRREADATTALVRDELKNWRCASPELPQTKYLFEPQPALRWSNPAAGRVYGDVYVCTADGLPAALLCLYKWYAPFDGFEAELHQLAATPFEAERDSEVLWRPQGGFKLQPFSDATAPAQSKAARMVQMRNLARGFSAHLEDRRLRRQADAEPHELRLLPKPIFRYGGTAGVIDGALFAFVLGTDPEAILMIQASPDETVGGEWTFGFARMNQDELWAHYRGSEVWRVPAVDARSDATAAYFLQILPQP